MTICPTYPYKLDVLKRNGIKGRNFIQLGAEWLSNDSYTTPEQLYSEVVMPIDEIVHSVRIYMEQLIDGKIWDLEILFVMAKRCFEQNLTIGMEIAMG